MISGDEAIRVAFRTGCASRQPGGHDESITPRALAATALRQPVAVLVSHGRRPPAYAREWRVHPLPDLGRRTGFRAYLSPVPRSSGQEAPGTRNDAVSRTRP